MEMPVQDARTAHALKTLAPQAVICVDIVISKFIEGIAAAAEVFSGLQAHSLQVICEREASSPSGVEAYERDIP